MFHPTLFTVFRDHIIEDRGSVNATFHIHITLMNDLYSSMVVDIELDSHLVRYCHSGDFRAGITVLDIFILVVIIFLAMAYSTSVIKAYKLAKVDRNYLNS